MSINLKDNELLYKHRCKDLFDETAFTIELLDIVGLFQVLF